MKKSLKIFRQMRTSIQRFQYKLSPQLNLVIGFLIYTIIGWLLLSIPFFHEQPVSWLDNLFISTSAISTTGLVTVGVADSYNLAGEIIVMLLFQIGGIGYMTLTTYYLLLTTNNLSRWHQSMIGAAFTMPQTFKPADFLKSVIVFTAVMEILGAVAFFFAFRSYDMPMGQAVWYSIFHSVSSFCTAGFGLPNDSFMGFANSYAINTIVSVLAISGSLGFIVITDLYYRIRGKADNLTFTTKIVLVGMVLMLAASTLIIYFNEPQLGDENRLLKAFFQSMTAMTTVGFNTIDTGGLALPILLMVTFLMYVGASPSGTAGGMKITTLTAMVAILQSRLKGQKQVSFLGRRIPYSRLYVATATFILYTSLIFLFTFMISFTEAFPFDKLLFEVASALGTVGLSTGITGGLSSAGKCLIILLMFIGRVGVLTFGFALLERKLDDREQEQADPADLAV